MKIMQYTRDLIKDLVDQYRKNNIYLIINSNIEEEELDFITDSFFCLENVNMAYLWIKKEKLNDNLGNIYPIVRQYVEPSQRDSIVIGLNIEEHLNKIIEEYEISNMKILDVRDIPSLNIMSVKTPKIVKERRKQFIK